ncbi:MAG: hypothetical protein AAF770_02600 [Bacteroidota bacterium]
MLSIVGQLNLLRKTIYIDTTSLSLYGEYSIIKKSKKSLEVTYGYSKNGLPSLRQVILSLATSGKTHLPLFMEVIRVTHQIKKLLIQPAKQIEKVGKTVEETPSFTYLFRYIQVLKMRGLTWIKNPSLA